MKTTMIIAAFVLMGSYACMDAGGRYLDLSTGESVDLEKDEKTGLMVNAETGEPVRMYVDRETDDTIWGASGKVINGRVVKLDNGNWAYKDDDEYKAKYGDDVKIKRDDDEYKIKSGDYKKEVEKDGDITIKDGDKKIKIDGETGEKKVKNDD